MFIDMKAIFFLLCISYINLHFLIIHKQIDDIYGRIQSVSTF